MSKTLLEKALAPARSQVDGEELELAIAWLNHKVTNSQVSRATGHASTNHPYGFIAQVLRDAVCAGKITIRKK